MNGNEKIREILLLENENRIKQQSKPLHVHKKQCGQDRFPNSLEIVFSQYCSLQKVLLKKSRSMA